jgi:putative serine/threonine protein kinase
MTEFSNKFVLSSSKLVDLLCYPRFSADEYRTRINELLSLNIKFVLLEGPTNLNSVNILGKGNEGLVLKVLDYANNTMAIKIRRTDSCRNEMANEFNFYKYVNTHNIGPKVHLRTKNILLMECIEGLPARKWFFSSKPDVDLVRHIIIDILNQCYKLDEMGLDHGQLNKLDNHVIISPDGSKCTIVDFESASSKRKVNNVTSALQGLILKGYISEQVNAFHNYDNSRTEFLNLLSVYKHEKCRKNFEQILTMIKCD